MAHTPKGFTIIEILMATTVFSVVLMIALGGFLQIGRIFYKGTINAQGQDITQRVVGQISSDIRAASSITLSQTVGNITYFCLGNNRYTVSLGTEVGTGNKFGLLRDTLPGSLACAAPCSTSYNGLSACPATTNPTIAPLTNPTELLNSKMRLGVFNIAYTSSTGATLSYNVSIRVISGDDEVLSIPNANDPSTIKCQAQLSVSQYCSVNELNTTIFNGF